MIPSPRKRLIPSRTLLLVDSSLPLHQMWPQLFHILHLNWLQKELFCPFFQASEQHPNSKLQKLKSFASRIHSSYWEKSKTPQDIRIKMIQNLNLNKQTQRGEEPSFPLSLEHWALPWKEEDLRSLSINFLSMMLSSTANTWNFASAATLHILGENMPDEEESEDQENQTSREKKRTEK